MGIVKTRWIGWPICERGMWLVRFRTVLEARRDDAPGGIEILVADEHVPLRERLRRLHAMQGR